MNMVATKPIEKMRLKKIAKEIGDRLKELEADVVRNPLIDGYHKYFYHPFAVATLGDIVTIRYSNRGQADSTLSKEEAGQYLRWLRAGNIGTHHDACQVNEEGGSSHA